MKRYKIYPLKIILYFIILMRIRALILREYNKPLMEDHVEIPEPGDDESVIVRVGGAGMCKTDVRLWKGVEPGRPNRLPFVLGHENAGIVERVGSKVQGLKPGDRVLVYAIWADCTYCRVHAM